MNLRAQLATGLRALTQPLSPSHVVDREATRSRFVFAALAVIVATAGLLEPTAVHWGAFWASALAVAATGVASLLPACWATLNRIGGLLLAAEIAIMVAATGGAGSPYDVFYAMLLIYATMFYSTRRLAATAVLLLVLFVAPHLAGMGQHSTAHWARLAVEIGVWAVIAVVTHDLMARVRAQNSALAASEQRYRSLFAQNPDAVFSLDADGRFTTMNAAGGRLVGLRPAAMLGRSFQPFVAPDELAAVEERFRAALDGTSQDYELTVLDAEGREIPAAVTSFPLLVDDVVVGVHTVLKDISKRRALEERLNHAALHDPLTGLANRVLLADRLEHGLHGRERAGEPVALLMLDLDGFKPVNDTHGHAIGDALLVEIATRLGGCIRPGDTLARVGGDEFALVLPDTDRCAAVEVAQRVLDEVARPASIAQATLTVGASIGIAVAATASAGEQLLRDADAAMYAAKRSGRGRYVVFSPTLETAGPGAVRVDAGDARAWASYMTALRAEIAQRKDVGALPGQARAPASVLHVLQALLASIEELPDDVAEVDLRLPERTALEEFVFHQAMVHHWADALVRRQILSTRRPPAADRFWSRLEAAVLRDTPAVEEPLSASEPVGDP